MADMFSTGGYVEVVRENASPELGLIVKEAEGTGTCQVALFRESGNLPVVPVAEKDLRAITLMVNRASGEVCEVVYGSRRL